MTCIVAIKTKNKIIMGADSAGVAGLSLSIRKDPKIYKNGPFLIGFTSSFRMGQLLGYSLVVPEQLATESIERFMNTTFVESVRECLKKGGYTEINNAVESGGVFIIGYKKRLFTMYSDFQIEELRGSFASVGCGGEVALGSLFSTEKTNKSASARVREALEAAEKFSAGVRKPFIMEEI